jgi:hypothetical protein
MKLFNNFRIQREIKKYQDKEVRKNEENSRKKTRLLWIFLIIIGFVVAYYNDFSWNVIIGILVVFFIFLIFDLFLGNYRLKKDILMYERSQNVRDSKIVQSIEYKVEQKRDVITHIILKNTEGYDVKIWSMGRANSMIIGKNSRIKVDVDLSNTAYPFLISKQHAILNKTDKGWYIEDLGSKNGTGIKKYSDNRKIKIGNAPVKVQSGDIIYIATTELLLK